jgi:hypothetical protein
LATGKLIVKSDRARKVTSYYEGTVYISGQYTMIGNGKFEPFTVWNDIKLRCRISASKWTS